MSCSALMDCVGCEKCRLWGKLQVLGLGTALKILFSADDHQEHMGLDVSNFASSCPNTLFKHFKCIFESISSRSFEFLDEP